MALDASDDPAIINEFSKWLELNNLLMGLVNILITSVEGGAVVAEDTYTYIRFQMQQAPISLDCQHPKSFSDLKALWAELEVDDNRHAKFVLGMWGEW
jgi:hypothetical protein